MRLNCFQFLCFAPLAGRCFETSHTISRIAFCITGTWRSFGRSDVYNSIASNATDSLGSGGAELGFFYVIDSAGTELSTVLPALTRLRPRMLALDTPPPPVPECLRVGYDPVASYLQHSQLLQCYQFIKDDERLLGRPWDWIVRLRTDMVFNEPLGPIANYDSSFLYMPPTGKPHFPISSWGFSLSQDCGDDRFALVPRHLADAYFNAFEDLCLDQSEVSFVSFNNKLEYLLLMRLFRMGAQIRFLRQGQVSVVRGQNNTDVGRIAGSLQRKSESGYQAVKGQQPNSFGGDGWVGAHDFSRASRQNPKIQHQWSDARGPLQVVLVPSWRFKDHVLVRRARFCTLDSQPASAAQAVLQVRVYRPVGTGRQFWRLIGTSWLNDALSDIEVESRHCAIVTLLDHIVAAPGDCLAYVMYPLTSKPTSWLADASPTESALMLGKALAAVSEFDMFERAPSAKALALSVQVEHVNHADVAPHCFLRDDARIYTFDYCCGMEALGPEGNSACWQYADKLPLHDTQDERIFFTYESCCIHARNFVSNSASTSADLKLKATVLELIVQSRPAAIKFLQTVKGAHATRPQLLSAEALYKASWWPKEQPFYREEIMPYLAEILWQPEQLCDTIMQDCNDCFANVAGREFDAVGSKPRVSIRDYCPLVLLYHPRIAASILSKPPNSSVRDSFPSLERPLPFVWETLVNR